MTEAELFTLLCAVLNAGFTSRAVMPAPDVRQGDNPRTVGTPTDPAVLLYKLSQKRYGFLRVDDEWVNPYPPDYPDGAMVHTETQAMEVTIQCGALVPPAPPPADLPAYAAGDLIMLASDILQGTDGLAALRAGGVGIERITDVRQPSFQDERGQFEASPSFDFVLTYNRTAKTVGPVLFAKELKIVAV